MSAKYIFVTACGVFISRTGGGVDWLPAGKPRSQSQPDEFDRTERGSGTMSPFQHGEVSSPTRGGTDLDLGHYERFTHANFPATTTGRPGASTSRSSPRSGRGLPRQNGAVIPHVTNEIKAAAKKVAQDVDVAIVEIGGTVATSNRCRLSKRSGRCGRNWAA